MKIATGAAVLILLAGCSATTEAAPAPTVTVTEYVPQPAVTVPVPGPTVTVEAAPPQPSGTVGDGVWTVGQDIPPGNYVTTAAVTGDCAWAITKTGTNGQEPVALDFPGGGRPRVTLKVGQDFSTTDCGEWAPA